MFLPTFPSKVLGLPANAFFCFFVYLLAVLPAFFLSGVVFPANILSMSSNQWLVFSDVGFATQDLLFAFGSSIDLLLEILNSRRI